MATSSSKSSAAITSATSQGVADTQAVSKAQGELANVLLFAKMMKTAEDGAQAAL